ncbi:MAG: SUMF1/EgtB/PvdO family nonheme iron enzyme [Treponema sp.]|nr:SUMF1/EgtB/PvdO family nonheme iron enzyme [Treponema sp.]
MKNFLNFFWIIAMIAAIGFLFAACDTGSGYENGSDNNNSPYLELSPLLIDFGALEVGYTQPGARTVTITNTGTAPAAISGIALGGANYDSFELSGTGSITTIGEGNTETFTVRPNVALPAGTYNATIIVTYNGGATATTNVTFTVSALPTFTVSMIGVGQGGTTTVANQIAGANVSINAGTNTGYTFVNWTSNPSVTFADPNSAITTFEMPDSAVTITANWTPTPHAVTMSGVGQGGTTTVANQIAGVNVSINAGTNPGYTFVNWTSNPSVTFANSNSADTTFIMPGSAVTITANWTPVLPIAMVRVEGGTFELGRELGTGGSGDITPVSTVTLTQGFYMGRFPITREQWTTVMTGNDNGITVPHPSWSSVAANTEESAAGFNINRRPATHVNWYDVIVFANRLSELSGLTPAYEMPNTWPNPTSWSTNPNTWGAVPTNSNERWNNVRVITGSTGYRLPTEAQWEFAAKGGNTADRYTFSGSNNAGAVAWHTGNSGSSPRMVGLLAANGLGIHDMSGNVLEWVWDWSWNYTSDPKTDPTGASSGANRIIRGGSWDFNAVGTRSVVRFNNWPNFRWYDIGFRLARP